jgi:uncharacterized membrane protein YedE/YeeE
MKTQLIRGLASALAGILFGAGLALSGMTDTAKVIGFLDILGNWRPDLALVMASALSVALIGFVIGARMSKPLLAQQFDLPKAVGIDRPLVLGAALFGIGWGIYGYCPGPAIGALVYGQAETLVFIVFMLAGMSLGHYLSKR